MVYNRIMTGYPGGFFRAQKYLTRAEAVATMGKADVFKASTLPVEPVTPVAPPVSTGGGGGGGGSDTPTNTAVTGVTLDKTSLGLMVGQTVYLTPTILPITATNKNVTWSTSNQNVATVNSQGAVTAVASGTATITVTTVDGAKTATCQVEVYDEFRVIDIS